MTEERNLSSAIAKLWLWKNFVDGRPEYWAFDNPYPCHENGDPMTLGEPCGFALVKESTTGRTDVSDEQVVAAIKRSLARSERTVVPPDEHLKVADWLEARDATYSAALIRRWYGITNAAPQAETVPTAVPSAAAAAAPVCVDKKENPSLRVEFEAWLDEVMGVQSEWQEERNCYADHEAHLAWKAWLESRRRCQIAAAPSRATNEREDEPEVVTKARAIVAMLKVDLGTRSSTAGGPTLVDCITTIALLRVEGMRGEFFRGVEDGLQRAIDALTNLRVPADSSSATAGWIALADQTPPDREDVLVTPGFGQDVSIDHWCQEYKSFLMRIEDGRQPTHWQSLPRVP